MSVRVAKAVSAVIVQTAMLTMSINASSSVFRNSDVVIAIVLILSLVRVVLRIKPGMEPLVSPLLVVPDNTGALTSQCILKGTSCGDNTDGTGGNQCNNDNTCDANEGCGCSDCTGKQDHCAAGLTCEYGGDGAQKESQCVGASCTNTQAPAELKAGVDQPYIACMGNGDATKTHFRYKLVKTSGSTTAGLYFSYSC